MLACVTTACMAGGGPRDLPIPDPERPPLPDPAPDPGPDQPQSRAGRD
ncbi:hypothetical protein [Paracoccus limosus]|jgi:hypothetical protein|nr:hypothetical protein [Paracoccus limosus]